MDHSTHTATFYVVIKAERSDWFKDQVNFIKARQLYKNKPENLGKDEIVVKLKVKVPDNAFEPFDIPEVEVEYTKPELTAVAEV